MPSCLRSVTIDYGFPKLSHARRRAISPHVDTLAPEDPRAARYRELEATTTDALVGDSFPAAGMLTLGFPSPAGERVDAWRTSGGSPSALVAELWRLAYPSVQRLAPGDLAALLSWFNGSKRTKIVETFTKQ